MALRLASRRADKLELSIALSDNVRTRPLIEGKVRAQGIELVPSVIPASEMVWRQLRFSDFDVSEMSLSTFFIAVAHGDATWIGLPVYVANLWFPHADIRVWAGSGITQPSDLRGKRVGVPEYQQTPAMWARGALQHEFGVHPSEIDWRMERPPEMSHGASTGFDPPPGVQLSYISPKTNLGEMLVRGEIDATLIYLSEGNLVDRSRIDLASHPQARRLFPDPEAEGRRYFAKTGLYPMRRIVVVRRSVIEQHPWVALNLYSAFLDAKAFMQRQMRTMVQPYVDLGYVERAAFAKEPMPYGIKAARPILERAAQYVYEQGLTQRLVAFEELFAPCALEL